MAETEKPKKDKKLKRMIELNPTIMEGIDAGKLDQLLRDGLVSDAQVPLARRALANPKRSVMDNQTRPIVAEALATLLDIVTHDAAIYQRLRADLQQRHKVNEGDMTGLVRAKAKATAAEAVSNVLGQHLGDLGKHIAKQAFKTDKSKQR